MRTFGNLSISLKLRLIIMATSSIALLLACAAFAAYDQASSRRWLVDDLSTDARIIGTNVTAAVAFRDHESANEVLSGLSIRTNISRARVFAENGEPFADYRRDNDAQPGSPEPEPEPKGARFLNGYLLVSEPIILDGEQIGTVCLVSDTKQLKGRLQKYIGIVGLVLLGALIVVLLVSSRLQRVISGPILHLAETARAVSIEKDYSIRAVKRSQDETGLLTDDFNEMLTQIDEREKKVQERTRQLQLEIAERQRIEQVLRDSDERYRAFVAGSSEGIWRFECDAPISITLPEDEQIEKIYCSGNLAECNDVMAQMYGLASAKELVGVRLGEILKLTESQNREYLRSFISSGYRLVDAESREGDRRGHVK